MKRQIDLSGVAIIAAIIIAIIAVFFSTAHAQQVGIPSKTGLLVYDSILTANTTTITITIPDIVRSKRINYSLSGTVCSATTSDLVIMFNGNITENSSELISYNGSVVAGSTNFTTAAMHPFVSGSIFGIEGVIFMINNSGNLIVTTLYSGITNNIYFSGNTYHGTAISAVSNMTFYGTKANHFCSGTRITITRSF